MTYKNITKSMVLSLDDGTDFFDMKGDTLAPHLLHITQDKVLLMLMDQIKENSLKHKKSKKKARPSRKYYGWRYSTSYKYTGQN